MLLTASMISTVPEFKNFFRHQVFHWSVDLNRFFFQSGMPVENPPPYSDDIVLMSFAGLSVRKIEKILDAAMTHLGWLFDGL